MYLITCIFFYICYLDFIQSYVLFFIFFILIYKYVDTLVRQAAMVPKCFLLMYYKNSKGRNYRKQVKNYTETTSPLKLIVCKILRIAVINDPSPITFHAVP